MIVRCGGCHDCGDCCILYVNDHYQRCQHYDVDREKHCTIHVKRPQTCRDFPRSPMDVANKPQCGYWFADERGHKMDGFMDLRVKLRRVK